MFKLSLTKYHGLLVRFTSLTTACFLSLPLLAFLGAPPALAAETSCGSGAIVAGDPTGKTASDTAFLNAFTAAANNGNKVCVPCGTYLIQSARLNAPANNFEIFSPNRCATLVLGPSFATDLISTNGKTGVNIHDLRITGSGSTASHSAIGVWPSGTGQSNTKLNNLYIHNVGVAVRTSYLAYPISGLSITNSDIGDTLSSAIVLYELSNFTFTGNKLNNWYTRGSPGGDGINYDMTSDISNWTVTNNTFIAGAGGSHAISQGPNNYKYVINGATFSNNYSTATAVGIAGQGMGYGIECNDCTITRNIFSNKLNTASGWRNCIEIYGTRNVKVTNNFCDNGTIHAGPLHDSANIDGFEISNNRIKTLGKLGSNTMSCISFTGIAGPGNGGSALSNIKITDNICDATLADTTNGVLGVVVGKSVWSSIDKLTISNNTIAQPAVNQAIRIVNPTQNLRGLVMNNNSAMQGLSFSQKSTYSDDVVSNNNFQNGKISDSTGSSGAITYTNNLVKP